jgi:hypothetical protein
LAVRVTDSATGQPIENAQVRLQRPVAGAQPPRDTMVRGGLASAAGWVQLAAAGGTYRIVAQRFGFVRHASTVEVRPGYADTLLVRLGVDTLAKLKYP